MTFDRTVTFDLLDWRMETKWGRFWNFSESTGYWKFCPRWWITNWKNCQYWKWWLWNILGRIWKSKRNTRTEIRLVLWRIEIAKCSMVLEYKSLRRVTNSKLFLGFFRTQKPNWPLLQGGLWLGEIQWFYVPPRRFMCLHQLEDRESLLETMWCR